ncbi:MAG: AAA family ATPase [Acidobacteria bacterium]|nr:AAA family ATPase [Acidobacteriota bacterium]
MTKLLESPKDLFARLSKSVIDQDTALEQICVSLYKHLNHIRVGNILLIGNSGTGKTTIMRNIEKMFADDERLSRFTNTIRLNANVVADDQTAKLESSIIINRLHQNATRIMGSDPSPERFKELMENGVVFLDEVDKIRAVVGDRPNARGIQAQEALLTLIEGELLELSLTQRSDDGELSTHKITVDTSRILFICGGAFEGLYDAVYRRVSSGEHRDKLIQEYVVSDGQENVEEKEYFSLNQYVRYEDMFEYGMTPQFLGRFDEIIVLNDLSVHALMRIFIEPKESVFRESQVYFQTLGIDLQITKEAVQLLAERAHENHRIGARALRSVFKRIMRGIEFDPAGSYLVRDDSGSKRLMVTSELVSRFA